MLSPTLLLLRRAAASAGGGSGLRSHALYLRSSSSSSSSSINTTSRLLSSLSGSSSSGWERKEQARATTTGGAPGPGARLLWTTPVSAAAGNAPAPVKTDGEEEDEVVEEKRTGLMGRLMSFAKPLSMRYALMTGGVVALYGVSTAIFDITTSLLGISHYDAAYVGFTTGFGCGCLAGLGVWATRKMISIRPEPVYQKAIRMVQRSSKVRDALGSPVKPTVMRSYRLLDGKWSVDRRLSLVWLKPRVQMLIRLKGSEKEGIALVEARRDNIWLNVHYVAVEVDDEDNSSHGDDDLIVVHGAKDEFGAEHDLREIYEHAKTYRRHA